MGITTRASEVVYMAEEAVDQVEAVLEVVLETEISNSSNWYMLLWANGRFQENTSRLVDRTTTISSLRMTLKRPVNTV